MDVAMALGRLGWQIWRNYVGALPQCPLPLLRRAHLALFKLVSSPEYRRCGRSLWTAMASAFRCVRSAKNYNSPASSSAVRPSTKKRHNWNDLEIVANRKDTPIRRCGGNQRGNWRNERRT